MEKEMALVYMLAGISSRFNRKIKSLEPIGANGETLLEYSLNQAIPLGFSKIIFIVGEHNEKEFKEKFGNNYKGIPIFYALQYFDNQTRDRPWGTADALISAKKFLDCPFVLCNGDDIYGESTFRILSNHLSKENSCASVGFQLKSVLPEKGEVNRGIFQSEKNYMLKIKEEYNISKDNLLLKGLKPNSLCSMNLYALNPSVLEHLEKNLNRFKEENKNNRKIESLIQNELSNLIKESKIKIKIYPSYDSWVGITHVGDEQKVKEFISSKKDIALVYMLAGISSRFGRKNKSLEIVGPNRETLLEYSLNQAIPLGFSKIIFIVGEHNEKEFREKFRDFYFGIPIEYFIQEYDTYSRDKPWGTGDALCSIKEIDCPFILCSGDDIYGKENLQTLYNHLKQNQEEATIGIKLKKMVPEKGKVNRGIFHTENDFVLDIHETCGISKEDLTSQKLDPESFCSMSLFALHPGTLNFIKEKLETFKQKNISDRKIEFFLPEAISDLIKENKIQMKLYPAKNKWFGITNIGDEIILKENLRNI